MTEIAKLNEGLDWYKQAYYKYLPDDIDDDYLENDVIKVFNIDAKKLQKERHELLFGKEKKQLGPQQIVLRRKLIIKRLQKAGVNIDNNGRRT